MQKQLEERDKLQQEQQQRDEQLRKQQLQEQQQTQQEQRQHEQQQLAELLEQRKRDQQLHEQHLREQQERKQQQLLEQQRREEELREQALREQQQREQEEREKQLREEQLREQQLKEQQLREQQLKEQQLKDQQLREKLEREQLEAQERQREWQQEQLRQARETQQQLEQQQLQQQQQQQQLQQQQQQLPSEGFLAVRQGPEPVRQFAPEQHRRPVQAFLQESEQERTVSAAAATSSVRVHSPAPALPGEGPAAEDCPCAKQPAGLAPASASFRTAAAGGAPAPAASGGQCWVSKVTVRQEHAGEGQGGMIMADVAAVYGSDMLTQAQRDMVHLARIASTSFQCLDDRVTEPSMSTPGGDLGEFILALASYLQERDPTRSSGLPPQKVIDVMLEKYSETLPAGRPMVHCTDDRAVRHLEAELPVENLDLNAPPTHAKEAGLLEKLTEVENQGDSHIRLMLKKPEWYELKKELVPMVLKSFYSLLWRQNQDLSAGNKLHQVQKLKLQVLVGDSNPSAFLEVSGGKLCHGDVAPMLTPRSGQRSVLISHLDAVSERRQELASFFARIANVTPRKIDRQKLHQRMERHGWLALETTGSRIAVGLPLYTLSYT